MVPAALVTAIYDSYDSLKPFAPQSIEVDAVCVTDNPDLQCDGWRIVYEPRPGMHSNRAAKRPKMLPHLYTEAGASVWIDASFVVNSPNFVQDALALADPVAQFVHPERDCLFDEAEVCFHIPKYTGEPMAGQVASYAIPKHWGLWATGVIARIHTDPVKEWGARWLAEVERWSFQDQLSHPFVCWTTGIRPSSLPGTHFHNPWLSYQGSGRH